MNYFVNIPIDVITLYLNSVSCPSSPSILMVCYMSSTAKLQTEMQRTHNSCPERRVHSLAAEV